LAGTVPFLSFVAEHYATKDVRAKLSVYPECADQPSLPLEAAAVNAKTAATFVRTDAVPEPVDSPDRATSADRVPGSSRPAID
jgi:hypothetical protein